MLAITDPNFPTKQKHSKMGSTSMDLCVLSLRPSVSGWKAGRQGILTT